MNFSCGHKPWMGVACVECRPDLATVKPFELVTPGRWVVEPDPTETEYVAAAAAYAEAWANHVNAKSITPRDVWAEGQINITAQIVYDCGVRFMTARKAKSARAGGKEPTDETR